MNSDKMHLKSCCSVQIGVFNVFWNLGQMFVTYITSGTLTLVTTFGNESLGVGFGLLHVIHS